jgi:hypothetical protein
MDEITKKHNEVLVKKLNRKASLLAQHVYLNQSNYQDREGDRKTTKERNKANKGIRINDIPFLHQT